MLSCTNNNYIYTEFLFFISILFKTYCLIMFSNYRDKLLYVLLIIIFNISLMNYLDSILFMCNRF